MTTDSDAAGGVVQHLVLRAARRRWPLVVLGVLVTVLIGFGASTQLPHKYTAEAQVLVNSVPSDASDPTKPKTIGLVAMSTEAQIARSSVVREAAKKHLPAGIDPVVLDRSAAVTVVTDSRVLRFTFEAHKKAVAQAGAQAFAEGYLDNRLVTAKAYVEGQGKRLTAQIAALEKQITTVTRARNNAADGSSERQTLNRQLQQLTDDLGTNQTTLAELSNTPVDAGQVIQAPSSAKLIGPTPLSVLGISLLLGLIFGLGIATLRERTDQRLLEPADLEDDLGVPLLAELPPPNFDGGVLDPDSAAADSYRTLRNEIFLGPTPPIVLAVSRVDTATGTGDVTANLAVLLARSGRRVCVIDTDTGPRRLDTLLEGVDRVGLVHAGAGGSTVEPGIAVVTQREGLGQAKLGDLLASPMFSRMVNATRQEAEVVLIDAPPALTSAGQAVLATADAVLLVVARRQTRRRDVMNAQERIRRAGSRLVGAALRDSEARPRGPMSTPGRRATVPDAQPALPPHERPALTGGAVSPTSPQTIEGTGVGIDITADASGEFRISRPTVYQPLSEQEPEPESTPESTAEITPVPVGWPPSARSNGQAGAGPVNGDPDGLGWPDKQPMLTSE